MFTQSPKYKAFNCFEKFKRQIGNQHEKTDQGKNDKGRYNTFEGFKESCEKEGTKKQPDFLLGSLDEYVGAKLNPRL